MKAASTPRGFLASVQAHDNYKRVWTRDGVMIGLGALLAGDESLIDTFKATIETLFEHQHVHGFMPSNVAPGGAVSYGGTAGRVDNVSWAIVGLCQYCLHTGDRALFDRYRAHVQKAFAVMDVWEFNGKHLLYAPQSGDWADEYIQHGYVLFNQLLRVWALRLAGKLAAHDGWLQKAEAITATVRTNYWNYANNDAKLYAPNLKHQLAAAPREHWLMGFNPAHAYRQFDLQANTLALLLSIGDGAQVASVLHYVDLLLMRYQKLLPSFYPAVEENDWEMNELRDNYAFTFRNKPHEFHNGGLWPVWNGLFCAALVQHHRQTLATRICEGIASAVADNEYEFNECLHGLTAKPIGVPYCVWSAAGLVIAEQALKGKRLWFD